MGTGSDVAIESAGITLIKGDIRGIARALGSGRETMKNIRQNLFLAFVYNCVGIPIAAGVLYPFFGVRSLLSPMIGECRYDVQFRVRHYECIEASEDSIVESQSWTNFKPRRTNEKTGF